MAEEKHIYDLAAVAEKWLNGTITAEERQWFEDWYASFDDENIELQSGKYHNTEQLRAAILTRINNRTGRTRKKRYTLFKRITSAAAVLILIIGAGVYLHLRNNRPAQKIVYKDVAPGHSGAILTLADGRQVVLDSASGNIAQQGNTQITNTTGQLVYNGNNIASRQVAYNTLSTPRARQYKIVLPDGTQVWLNAASSITYPTAFTGAGREVSIKGEAYFEVTHDAKHPFIVNTGKSQVTVLGTHFDVMAYEGEKAVLTTLLEGSVKVTTGTDSVKIVPGQQAATGEGKILVRNVDAESTASWVKGELSIENVDIAALLRQISRWYDVDIQIKGTLPEKHFFGMIDRNTAYLSQILDVLKENGLHVEHSGNKIIVSEQ